MFTINIYNTKTNESFVEHPKNQQELDFFIDSMHIIYGNDLKIYVSVDEDNIITKTFSEKPPCPECNGKEIQSFCKVCGKHPEIECIWEGFETI